MTGGGFLTCRWCESAVSAAEAVAPSLLSGAYCPHCVEKAVGEGYCVGCHRKSVYDNSSWECITLDNSVAVVCSGCKYGFDNVEGFCPFPGARLSASSYYSVDEQAFVGVRAASVQSAQETMARMSDLRAEVKRMWENSRSSRGSESRGER